jgi:excisionase family DNA binding protein
MEHIHFPAPLREATDPGREPGRPGVLLTVAEVAAILRVSTMTVYRLIRTGQLAAVRVGHGWRIPQDAVERYLASRTVGVEEA